MSDTTGWLKRHEDIENSSKYLKNLATPPKKITSLESSQTLDMLTPMPVASEGFKHRAFFPSPKQKFKKDGQ